MSITVQTVWFCITDIQSYSHGGEREVEAESRRADAALSLIVDAQCFKILNVSMRQRRIPSRVIHQSTITFKMYSKLEVSQRIQGDLV